ncbi:MAG: hypothetical protein PHX02_01635 [Oscillospiraceae bacterium]|nr:hypothetical protein [Oscillospiraceae bacterium]
MASLNITPLNFSDIDFTNKQQVKKLQNYLFLLTEQLQFTLNNLTLDDLNNLTNSIDNKMIKPGSISDDKLYSRYMLADTAHFTFATIEQLTADYINANQIAAKYATIEQLQAEDGYIASLRADVANIGNIMAGNIGSGSLQSLVINSVNTSIANATIKSAMIESINTGEVEIASSDGRLQIADNTIQIKDSSRVRVQLGKDELGDYNLYVWDADGNLMFDAAGLHEDGIKGAIIRDSMVASDANISAAKIFVENGEGGEKLSILFNEMDSDIASLQTSVELANGKLGVLMSDTEYEQNQGGATLYTKYSVLAQDVDSFKIQITEHINNVPIYTWIKYSDDPAGANMDDNPTDKLYIGIAYGNSNQTPSDNPADYKWTKIKGDQGIKGEQGPDGRTSYLHIKYSNDGGSTFTANNGEAVGEWIGTYVDFNSEDSNNVLDYTWNKVKGEKGDKGEKGEQGPQGIEGPKGADGQSLYTWVKYADSPTSGMSDSPTGKEYIGLAYNKTTPTESTNYGDYTWSKIKGEQGVEGPKGADGNPNYTWIKYADDAQGNGISDDPAGKRFLGLAYNKTTATESNNAADYCWSPLYDNVKVGGKNLLKLSGVPVENSHYPIKTYELTENIPQGTQVTVSIKGMLGSGKTHFGLYNSGGSVNIISLNSSDLNSNGVFVKTFDWVVGSSNNTHLYVYPMPSSVSEESSIEWIKLEKGNVSSDWSPAPEDIEQHFEIVESSILQNANDITLKVSKNDLINQINLSTEGIKIQGNRVDILGNTVFSSLIDTEGGQTVIDGAKIKTGSIAADDITTGLLKSRNNFTWIDMQSGDFCLGFYKLYSNEDGTLTGMGNLNSQGFLYEDFYISGRAGVLAAGLNTRYTDDGMYIPTYTVVNELRFMDYESKNGGGMGQDLDYASIYQTVKVRDGYQPHDIGPITIESDYGVELKGGLRGVTIDGWELMTAREIYPWNETGVTSGIIPSSHLTDNFSHFLVTYSIGGAALETQIVENYSDHRYFYLKTINLANGPSTSTSHAIYEARIRIYSTYFEFDYNRGVQVANGAYSASPLEDQFIIKRIVGLKLKLG